MPLCPQPADVGFPGRPHPSRRIASTFLPPESRERPFGLLLPVKVRCCSPERKRRLPGRQPLVLMSEGGTHGEHHVLSLETPSLPAPRKAAESELAAAVRSLRPDRRTPSPKVPPEQLRLR